MSTPSANDKRELFHKTLGIIQGKRGFLTGRFKKDSHSHGDGDVICVTGGNGSYYGMLLEAYRKHSYQYWFIASLINFLYLIQIVLAATATAVSALNVARGAVTVLTAISTVVAGVLAFLKSRGQPNRVRQLRNDLRKACIAVQIWDMEFRNPLSQRTVEEAITEVRKYYDTARLNAESNMPDSWSTPQSRAILQTSANTSIPIKPGDPVPDDGSKPGPIGSGAGAGTAPVGIGPTIGGGTVTTSSLPPLGAGGFGS
jgi:hypothetical protein